MLKRNSKTYYMMRSAVKVTVDACILPGTMMGTELTLLYIKQWRKEYSALCFGILSALLSIASFSINLPGFSHTRSENQQNDK